MRVSKAIGVGVLAAAMAASATNAQDGRKGGKAAALSGNPGQFFGADNYPPEALRNHEQGRTVAKLQVGPEGRVTACTVDVSSGSSSLDRTTCEIALARVKFTPATDARGRPVASGYMLPVRWVLPEEGAATPRISFDQQAELEIGADDKLLGCKLFSNGRPYDAVENPFCVAIKAMNAVQLHAYKGEGGPAHAIVTLQHAVQFEGAESLALAYKAPGHKVLRLTRMLADVMPDGTVSNARVVEQVGMPDLMMTPDKALGPFAPAADKIDQVTLIDAISIAPAP